jgi:capsular polysaccharide biosynthesis protein
MPERGGSSTGTNGAASFFLAVRRHWWLVLVIVVLAVAASVVATRSTPTSYTARASLIVSSNDRSPDQDAVLVQGYVLYFNDAAYQSQILRDARVGPEVTVVAHAAAASPILLIDATAPRASTAQAAAASVARAFEAAINKVRDRQNAADIADLQERLNNLRVSGNNSQSTANLANNLEARVLQLQADSVNKLQELQLRAGVTQNAPSLRKNVLLALLGGVLLGLVAAQGAERIARSRREATQVTTTRHDPDRGLGAQPDPSPQPDPETTDESRQTAEQFLRAGSGGSAERPGQN